VQPFRVEPDGVVKMPGGHTLVEMSSRLAAAENPSILEHFDE
jgi:hypothetical protein